MTDIFDPIETPDVDPNKDYLNEFVGEGKKFRDVQALARGKAAADAHIRKLEAEAAVAREAMQNSKTIEDFVNQMRSQSATRQDGDNQPFENGQGKPPAPVISDNLDEVISQKLSEARMKEKLQANQDFVKEQLQQKFGDNYVDKVLQVAGQFDMTKEEMSILAAQKPKAFLKLIDDSQQTPRSNVSPPDNRMNSFGNPTNGVKTYSYYQNLRRSDPKAYQRAQPEMHREALKQGAAFFDN